MRRFFYLNPKIIIFILLLLLYLYILNIKSIDLIEGNTPTIVINEIYPDAIGSDSGKEWLELFNASESPITLNGWYIKNISSSGSSRVLNLGDILINPREYLVISESNTNLNISNIYTLTSLINMYNSSSSLELYNQFSELIDRIEYTPTEGNSLERSGPLCNTLSLNSLTTPGILNSNYDLNCDIKVVEEIKSSVNLKFNEVVRDGSGYIIELKNLDGVVIDNFLDYRVEVDSFLYPITECISVTWCKINVTVVDDINVDNLRLYFKESLIDELPLISDLGTDNSYSILEGVWAITSFKTINSENIINAYTDILITEVYPSPENLEEEWIEIYNFSQSNLNLKELYFKERLSNGEYSSNKNYLPDSILNSNTHYSISGFNLTLNNSGDKVGLFLNDTLIDELTYPSISYSKSYSRKYVDNKYINEWNISDNVSQALFNPQIYTSNPPELVNENIYTPYSKISDLKNLNRSSKVKFKGCINTSIGIISDNVTYLEDEFSAIRVKFDEYYPLNINDCIEVEGKVSSYKNEKYISIDKYILIQLDYLVTPLEIDINNIKDEYIGKLVKFSGEITRKYSTSIKFNNIINVYPLEFFNISELDKNSKYNVLGILSKEDNKYRIYIVNDNGITLNDVLGDSISPISYTRTLDINNDEYKTLVSIYTYPIYLILIVLSLCILNLENLKNISVKIRSFLQSK